MGLEADVFEAGEQSGDFKDRTRKGLSAWADELTCNQCVLERIGFCFTNVRLKNINNKKE